LRTDETKKGTKVAMQVIRTIVWVVITALLVGFIAINWNTAPVNFWPLAEGYLHFEWPVGFIALAFFLLGLLPMWLISLIGRWRYARRINALENSVRAVAPLPPVTPATQLDAAASDPPST
jgi:putative membrane protein